MRPLQRLCLWLVALGLALGLGPPCVACCAAADESAPAGKRPAARRSTTETAARLNVTWQAQPLRAAMHSLAQSQRVSILIDRRLDPGTPLTGQFQDATLAELLERAAESAKGAATALGPVQFLGPADATARLRTLAAMLAEKSKSLPADVRQKLGRKQPLVWSDYATPRDILTQLSEEIGWRWRDLDSVPHDLWAAVETPPLPWTDRVTLVLSQFDLTVDFDPPRSELAVVPLPERIAIERRYPGGASAERRAEEFRQRIPAAAVEVAGRSIVVRARVEEHEILAAKPVPASAAPVAGEDRYQLQLADVPLRKVLKALETRLKVTFEFDEAALTAAGVRLDDPVRVQVRDATFEELLAAVLTPAGVTYRRDERRITLAPREE